MTHETIYYPDGMAAGDTVKNHQPIPENCRKSLPGFASSERLKHKNGARPSWSIGKGWHAEWDSQHGTVEVYDKKNKHQGEYDPLTGELTKEADPKRQPTYKSVAMDKLKEKLGQGIGDLVVEQPTPQMIEATKPPESNVQYISNPNMGFYVAGLSPGDAIRPNNPYGATVAKATAVGIVFVLIVATEGSAAPVLKPILEQVSKLKPAF